MQMTENTEEGEQNEQKRNGKIINSFLLGTGLFHSSINFSRTFENSALYKGQ